MDNSNCSCYGDALEVEEEEEEEEEEETPQERVQESGEVEEDKESKNSKAAPGGPAPQVGFVLSSIYHLHYRLYIFTALQDWVY